MSVTPSQTIASRTLLARRTGPKGLTRADRESHQSGGHDAAEHIQPSDALVYQRMASAEPRPHLKTAGQHRHRAEDRMGDERGIVRREDAGTGIRERAGSSVRYGGSAKATNASATTARGTTTHRGCHHAPASDPPATSGVIRTSGVVELMSPSLPAQCA